MTNLAIWHMFMCIPNKLYQFWTCQLTDSHFNSGSDQHIEQHKYMVTEPFFSTIILQKWSCQQVCFENLNLLNMESYWNSVPRLSTNMLYHITLQPCVGLHLYLIFQLCKEEGGGSCIERQSVVIACTIKLNLIYH